MITSIAYFNSSCLFVFFLSLDFSLYGYIHIYTYRDMVFDSSETSAVLLFFVLWKKWDPIVSKAALSWLIRGSRSSGIRAQFGMSPHRNPQRNVRDILIEDLQKEIQQLQQWLARFKQKEIEERRSLNDENLEDGIGDDPAQLESSGEDLPKRISPRRRYRDDEHQWMPQVQFRRDYGGQRDLGIKIDIPEFDGRLDFDELCDWLSQLREFWNARTFRRIESFAWLLLSWRKIRHSGEKYFPYQYRQELFLKLHQFR